MTTANNNQLAALIQIRDKLTSVKHDRGEIVGKAILDADTLLQLQTLSQAQVIDDIIHVNGENYTVSKLSLNGLNGQGFELTLYTHQLSSVDYYDNYHYFIELNQQRCPTRDFYIHDLKYNSTDAEAPLKIQQYREILEFIQILELVADYVSDDFDNFKELILFQKRKLVLKTIYSSNQLRNIQFNSSLREHFEKAHDKEERKSIFKTEIITTLAEIKEESRFSELLSKLDTVYDTYIKSHLLYLEKFSYFDLKSSVDNDKLDYTKKIYATVNDIQAKLVAVPAAFLLLLSSFDFTGSDLQKNVLLTIGACLFSILLEILLSNQFGVLKYLKNEIASVSNTIKNKETELNLSEFINSFSGLDSIIGRQRTYLWIFRGIVWSITLTAFYLLKTTP